MIKFETFIAELCPDGVEYKFLSDVAHYSKIRISGTQLNSDNYVGVDNLLPGKQGKTTSIYVPDDGAWTYFDPGNILLGNIRPYLKKIWMATHSGGTNGDVLVIQISDKATLSPDFLYYVLSSDDFFAYDVQFSKGAKMPRGDKSAIMRYCVPIPPLPIQQEIVRILDTFTALEAELEAELEKREQQYEYYTDKLLKCVFTTTWVTLGEIASISVGQKPNEKIAESGRYPVINAGTTQSGFVSSYNTNANFITTPSRGQGGIGSVGFQKKPFWCGPLCYRIKSNTDDIDTKFLYYYMVSANRKLLEFKQTGSVPALNRKELTLLKIPILPLAEQERIVAILDRFYALVNDITQGLPAEIAARRKQYEYYRDKLLTFKRKDAAV